MNFFKRFRFGKKKDRQEPCARDRMLELHSTRGELEPLVVNCDRTQLYNESVDDVPVLEVCVSRQQSPLIDHSTFNEVLRNNFVFPVVRRDMSYSIEVCGNRGQSLDCGENQAPPNVNIFAPHNSIRRPVISRLTRNDNTSAEFDFYNDIPHPANNQLAEIEFPYIQTPSVTSSGLSEIDNYHVLEQGPGYVNLNPAAAMPEIDSSNFYAYSDVDLVQQQEQYPTFPAYFSEPSQIPYLNQDPGPANLSAIQTVSYNPPMIPITEPLSPIIPDLVTQDTPVLCNLPVVYIIPVVPLSIQPLFLAPIEPSSFTYLPAPLAFNCVLRTPFPQFIYSVEPCEDPGCPFSYRYRCPTPQLNPGQTEQRRRTTRTTTTTTSCQFSRSSGFNYQCSNCQSNENEEIEEDTPRRKDEKIPPPVRRLSDKFDSPRHSTSNPLNTSHRTETSIETVTTHMDSISLNGNEFNRMSQIRVRISARDENHHRGRQHPRASQVVQFRRNKRNGILKPRNVCFHRQLNGLENNSDVLKSTMISEVTLARSKFNCADWLKIRDFSNVHRCLPNPLSFQRRPYLLSMSRNGPLPQVLQEVSVPVINNSVCESMYQTAGYIEHIPNIFICAGWRKGGFDSCEGDSGGPMVIQRPDKRWLLAGIISWGIGCAEPNQPGVYTRISAFRDWINQILQF